MRILYGVVGEGMGHAIRSRVVIDHLIRDEGHEVEVVVSGRAFDVLQRYFPNVHRIWGLSMTYRDNQFKAIRSAVENTKSSLAGIPENIRRYFEVTSDFCPECVISDFESWSYLYGLRHNLPVYCVDNIQMVNRCTHPASFIEKHEKVFRLAKSFVKGKLPGCRHYYITTFFYPPIRKRNTTLVPPVLRPEILAARPTRGDHILVYLTSESAEQLVSTLESVDLPFKVYGHHRGLTEDLHEANVVFRPFDEKVFIEDLASSRAVIANGGFTLLSEAVYMRKPILSIPIRSQFEQLLNAHYVAGLGYGRNASALNIDILQGFIKRLGFYEENLSRYDQSNGNDTLFGLLDEQLDRAASKVS